MKDRWLVLALLLVVTMFSPGCAFLGIGHKADSSVKDEYRQMVYPKDTPVAGDVDIVVEQKRGRLRLTNRSVRTFSNVQVWINEQYVSIVPEIATGENASIPLNRFVNRHGEPYPIGGLLKPDKAFPIVRVELFIAAESDDPDTTGQRLRLLATALRVQPQPR